MKKHTEVQVHTSCVWQNVFQQNKHDCAELQTHACDTEMINYYPKRHKGLLCNTEDSPAHYDTKHLKGSISSSVKYLNKATALSDEKKNLPTQQVNCCR